MKYYMGVASKNHIELGKEGGFCQFCHGKQPPAKKLNKNDWIIYYSPKVVLEEKELCQKFTAIGQIIDDKEYQVEQFSGFMPWRRNVVYYKSIDVDIRPIVNDLSFIKSKTSWGMVFRYGFFEIQETDFGLIKSLMII